MTNASPDRIVRELEQLPHENRMKVVVEAMQRLGMSWDFTINGANGRPCLHYQDTATGLTLVVGNQTVSETMYGTLGVRITCPDGTSVQTANATNLLGCPGGLVVLPGLQWSSSDTFVTTTLLGTGNTTLQLFDCRKN